MEKKVQDLMLKARQSGRFALAAAASDFLQDVQDIDRKINLIGALHETGSLKNSLAPYWQALRSDEKQWIARCLARLKSGDADYWALAALLGCEQGMVQEAAQALGWQVLSRWSPEPKSQKALRFVLLHYPNDLPDVGLQTKLFSAVLELGAAADNLLQDVSRARALSMNNAGFYEGLLHGSGSLSYTMTAKLPQGAWRSESVHFMLKKAQLLIV